MNRILCLLNALLPVAALAAAPAPVRTPDRIDVTSQASPAGGKYGIQQAFDGLRTTHWASAGRALPQVVTVEWNDPVTFDTVMVDVFSTELTRLYADWKTCRVVLDNGTERTLRFDEPPEVIILRFDQLQTCTAAELHILEVFETKTYVGIDEIGFYTDPDKRLAPPRKLAKPLPLDAITPQGRDRHPCVYVTPEGVERARRNAEQTQWGAQEKDAILKQAAPWLERTPEHWLSFLPEPGACYAYGFTACPICGSRFGTWAGARCSWEEPGKVRCAEGHVLPNQEYPDDGTGYQAEDGRHHYLVGSWNSWVTEQWTRRAIPALAHAYALTGDERYAERAALFLDALASIYPESTSGSWDYPSRPPSGRFARPWYQVARNLVVFVEAYDLIYTSDVLDEPSVRPGLEETFPEGPTAQQRAVGTKDARGWSKPDMTRRENIDRNLMIDGAHYCYRMTFKGGLHNGAADYMRGALAVGALLGIEPYVTNAIESPYSIYAMLANNADRDGRYFETALGYALHARSLYLTFVEPLLHWRSDTYPNGVNLFDSDRMRSFYLLPDLVMDCAGHSPNYGDVGPDNHLRFQPTQPFSRVDAKYAEWLLAYAPEGGREAARGILAFLADGDMAAMRKNLGDRRWLLYRADPDADEPGSGLSNDLRQRLFESWFMGQKGIGILRDGRGSDAQAALLRYGPSLNHGDKDDLGLIYYGRGWQLTYEIGYGLGSTHTQVGWGSQTASHCLVTVDESSQKGASGGSLCLFADLPGIKIMEAESPLSYAASEVSQYRRTVALVGQGSNQVLVDLFRVRGGSKHDYTVGVQTQEVTTSGLDLGPEMDGSLAPDGIAWGESLGLDGDIKGHPNKPYWNPPPGNGYGFFYDPRHAAANGPFFAEFNLGGRNDARFRVHALPESRTEAVVAKAPGLYPHNSNAAYLVLRRKAEEAGLQSTFATVMEPYARPTQTSGIGGAILQGMISDSNTRTKVLSSYDTVFVGGEQEGDFVEFEVPVEQAGRFDVIAALLKSPSYGTVRLYLDGTPLGELYDTTATTVSGPERVTFGTVDLNAGTHRVRLESGPGKLHYFGVAGLSIQAPEDKTPAEEVAAKPVIETAQRVAVEGPATHMIPVGVHLRRDGRDEYLLSASPEDDAPRRAVLPHGEVTWKGAVVFLAFRDGQLEQAATHGAWDLAVAGRQVGPSAGRIQTSVREIATRGNAVIVDGAIQNEALGSAVLFRNPGYSRDSGYRLYGVEPLADGRTRIDLGPQPMLLGQGRVHQIANATTLSSDVPHDYARSVVGGSDTAFFNGKRVTNGDGADTSIRRIVYGQPMTISVDDTGVFEDGDMLYYHDVQPGDTMIIPTVWTMTSGQ